MTVTFIPIKCQRCGVYKNVVCVWNGIELCALCYRFLTTGE